MSDEVRQRGGVARVDALRRAGVSAHALRAAREARQIVTVRRGWVASPDADPMLVEATRRGVLITCVTLAQRRGLWVRDSSEPHVAAHPKSGHIDAGGAVVHWSTPVFPRHPEQCEDSLENALILIARCQPYEAALAIWESAANKGMLNHGVLARVHLPPAARTLLRDASPFADAGTETIFLTRLKWLRVPIVPQAWILGHRVDFLIGARLIVQIDGGHHVGAQRTSDIRHDARLMLQGYHVIRISYSQLMSDWPAVQTTIMAAIAQRLHLAA